MQITVYSTTTCPYCKMLKDYLKEKSLSFTEKLVDLDEAAKVEMTASSGGFLGVPFISILKDDSISLELFSMCHKRNYIEVGSLKGRLSRLIHGR